MNERDFVHFLECNLMAVFMHMIQLRLPPPSDFSNCAPVTLYACLHCTASYTKNASRTASKATQEGEPFAIVIDINDGMNIYSIERRHLSWYFALISVFWITVITLSVFRNGNESFLKVFGIQCDYALRDDIATKTYNYKYKSLLIKRKLQTHLNNSLVYLSCENFSFLVYHIQNKAPSC